jgi:hypothetical protein
MAVLILMGLLYPLWAGLSRVFLKNFEKNLQGRWARGLGENSAGVLTIVSAGQAHRKKTCRGSGRRGFGKTPQEFAYEP